MAEREKFGSFGALMAMAGSAVGLGNMWRFPYLLGANGGAAFLIIYVIFSFCIALPMFFAEFIVGRRGHSDCVGSFKKLSPGTKWYLAGIMSVITPLVICFYYCVVGGWSVQYFFKACMFQFSGFSGSEQLHNMFSSFITSLWPPIIGFVIFLLVSLVIVKKGVKGGIEKFGKVMMPALFVIILAMSVYVCFLPGVSAGYSWLFKPDFSAITPGVVVAALGQAFFSMSLGCGCIMTYASYVDKKEDLVRHCGLTTLLDLLFAIFSACAIMPAVFAFDVDPASGPSLIFETLPFIFSRMPAGDMLAILFFFALIIAALTSIISMIETVTVSVSEKMNVSRKKSILYIGLLVTLFGSLCCLSFGPLSGVKIAGMTIFDFFNCISTDILIVGGAFLIVIFVGWKMKKEDVRDEFTMGGTVHNRLFGISYFTIRYICPLAILAISLSPLLFR